MKKKVRGVLALLCLSTMMVACKSSPSLLTKDVTSSAILLLKDGSVQSAIVEDFDKDYYSKDELKSFISGKISEYNALQEGEVVKLEKLAEDSNVVTAKMSYSSVADYEKFNDVEFEVLSASEARTDKRIPDEVKNVSDGSATAKAEALDNDKYKVLITETTGFDIIVDGKVKYYSNGVLVNDSTVQNGTSGTTIIVYE